MVPPDALKPDRTTAAGLCCIAQDTHQLAAPVRAEPNSGRSGARVTVRHAIPKASIIPSGLADSVAPSSAGAAMTPPLVPAVDTAAEARWIDWQASGAASDRRSGRIMSGLLALVVILIVGWLVAQ